MVADNIVQLIKTKFVLLQKDKYKDKDKDKGRGKTKTGKQGWPSNSKSYFNLSAVHNLEASNLQCGPPMNLLKEIGESGNRHDQWGLGRETRISGEEPIVEVVYRVEGGQDGEVEGGQDGEVEGGQECVFSSRGLTSWSTKEGILRKSSNRNSKNSQRLWTRVEEWRCRGWTRGEEWRCRWSKSKSKFSLTWG